MEFILLVFSIGFFLLVIYMIFANDNRHFEQHVIHRMLFEEDESPRYRKRLFSRK